MALVQADEGGRDGGEMSADVGEPVKHLEYNGVKITILGTAHISKASVETVKRMIAEGDYDTVALELCANRYQSLVDPDAISRLDIMQVVRNGKGPMVMVSLALSAFQRRLADQLDIEPGADMLAGAEAAQARKLDVCLIDRDVGITLRRINGNISAWRRLKLLSGLMASVIARRTVSEQEVEQLKKGDVLESTFKQFAAQCEEIYTPLVDERDRYMAARLMQEAGKGKSKHILAVVGAGHMSGICRYVEEAKAAELSQAASASLPSSAQILERLKQVPPPGKFFLMLSWFIVAVILAGFAVGFAKSGDLGWELVWIWVLVNGTLSALGALLALAHPITVVSAFFAAPLTSLNPAFSAGVVTAAVQTMLRKPSVGDFASLRVDTATFKGWWTNRVAHAFVVFFFSGMGSVIGTYVAGYKMFTSIAAG